MKKIAIFGALLALAGCAPLHNYHEVVKAPAPAGLAGYWQSAGPQSAMISPEAMATLVITKEGDTLDCRQWLRVIALPGKLTKRGDDIYNVTTGLDMYEIDRDGGHIEYDRMTLKRVDRPTVECADYLQKHPLGSALP